MTKEEAIEQIKNIKIFAIGDGYTDEAIKALAMAIKSLEAWGKIEKEIDDSILICRESAQNNIWYDGELAGFLQSKDIINGNLSEVNNANSN